MFKKKQFKSLICTILTFLMVFTSVNIGTLGMKQVFAETIKKESEIVETENLSSKKGDKALVNEKVDKPSIKTNLKNMTTKSDKLTFDLWAKDANGNKIKGSDVKVTNNEKPVSVNWDDKEKTSYTLKLEVGTNNVKININYNEKNYTQRYTLTREQAEDGEKIGTFTFSMEAFTIGLGYLIEPIQVDIHKGRNAAQELDAILKEYGYKYRNTGKLEEGFYLATLLDGTNKVYKTTPKIPEVLKKKLDENCRGNYDEKRYNSECGLGEFDFNNLSGWMYAVNNVFPNVGFAGKYLQDGDVMRVQFTLALGNDIGGSDAMGGGSGAEFFPKVNKDELTKKIAQINSSAGKDKYLSNSKIKRAYDNGIEILQKFGISQQEIDKASKNLAQAVEKVDDMTGTLPKPDQPGKTDQHEGVEEKFKKELKDKFEKISIKDNELNIKKEGEKALLSIKEGALNSAIKEVEELIKEIEEKHEDINFKKNINVIPIDISKTKEEKIVFKVEEDSIKTLKDKGLGVKINFGDIEVKVPNTIIARESDGKQLEIRKNVASKNIENKIVKALNDKVLLPSYNVSLYEVGDSEKKVSMKGTEVSVKVDSKYFKNIRKNGTKIKLYDSESGKWILLKSKFDEKTNRVIGNVRQ